ncbi:MAG TPA: anti-sigma factor [Gemmatimonas sp.]|nr:anti-sigma factor [Gemmatimonas sp.]
MKPLSLDELRELSPGFVMGTLSIDERRAFDIAMSDAATAAALAPEIAAHRAAVEFLASAHSVTPPPALKARVLARIAAEPNTVQSPTPASEVRFATPVTIAPVLVTPAASSAPQLVRVKPQSTAAKWTAASFGIALAASLVFALDMRSKAAELESQLTEQNGQLAAAKQKLAEREKTLATIMGTGGDVTLVRLSPSQPTGPGMQVFWNVREGRAIITASGLAPVGKDRAYALWMIRDGKPVPLALFNADAGGRAVVQNIEVPKDLVGVAAFAVTEEPATGSPQPTMTPFLVGAVAPAAPQ